MKFKLFLLTTLFLVTGILAETPREKSFLLLGNNEIGGYLSVGGRYTTISDENGGFLDGRAALVFNGKWAVGVSGSALYYDKTHSELVDDGTYHLNLGYTGLWVERIFSITPDFKFSASLMAGLGTAFYRYDHDYRKDKVWSEEIIDQNGFAVQEVGVEIQHRIKNNFWLGINGSYRNTSPLKLIGTDDDLIKNFNLGVNFKYGIF